MGLTAATKNSLPEVSIIFDPYFISKKGYEFTASIYNVPFIDVCCLAGAVLITDLV
jgi:hypothetical protein